MASKPVLGKGLASLLPGASSFSGFGQETGHGLSHPLARPPAGASASPDVVNKDRQMGVSMANVEDIAVNQYQPRRDFDDQALEELAQSIRSHGIIQPLVVRKTQSGGYQLIAGERRLRASKLAGIKQVPVVIRRSTDREALELALIENIQRQNLNCVDEALAYFQLLQDFSLTQEEVAQRVGKDRATVANHLRLLRLPEAIIDDLKRGIFTFGHGKALLAVDDNDLRLRARAQIVENKLSVRDTEKLIEQLKRSAEFGESGNHANPIPQPEATPHKTSVQTRLGKLSQDLTRQYTAKVEIKGSERKGKIVIQYATRMDLERVLTLLQK